MTKHNKIKLFLKIAGLFLLTIGIVLAIIAFVDFFSSFMSEEMKKPTKFWLFFIGFPAISIGGVLTAFGFKRGLLTYVKNESVPVINEAASELDGTFSSIAHSVKKGLADENEKCSCGALNKKGSKFCNNCGKKLKEKCTCETDNV